MSTIANIKLKIQKLLALAGNNPNIHERGQALAKAHELMAEYNLEKKDIEGYGETGPEVSVMQLNAKEAWISSICVDAAIICYCRVLFEAWGKQQPLLIGEASNRQCCETLIAWLVDAIKRESRKTLKGRERKAFCLGAAIAIGTTVKRILREEQARAITPENAMEKLRAIISPGTELAVVRKELDARNTEVVKALSQQQEIIDTELKPEPMGTLGEYVSMLAGRAFGSSLPLNRVTAEDKRVEVTK